MDILWRLANTGLARRRVQALFPALDSRAHRARPRDLQRDRPEVEPRRSRSGSDYQSLPGDSCVHWKRLADTMSLGTGEILGFHGKIMEVLHMGYSCASLPKRSSMSNDVLATGSAAGAFHFGEFVFDARLRQLLCGGQPRQLSPKAQQLLLLLLHARPRALAREELYDALWPTTFVCETNLASVVNELRRALGDHARAPRYIRTVHSFGYAFCGDVAASGPGRAPAGTLLCYRQKHQLYAGENSLGRGADCQIVVPDPTARTLTDSGSDRWLCP